MADESLCSQFSDWISSNRQPVVYHSPALITSTVKFVEHGMHLFFLYVIPNTAAINLIYINVKCYCLSVIDVSVSETAALLHG
jgi:hypothetical protein